MKHRYVLVEFPITIFFPHSTRVTFQEVQAKQYYPKKREFIYMTVPEIINISKFPSQSAKVNRLETNYSQDRAQRRGACVGQVTFAPSHHITISATNSKL